MLSHSLSDLARTRISEKDQHHSQIRLGPDQCFDRILLRASASTLYNLWPISRGNGLQVWIKTRKRIHQSDRSTVRIHWSTDETFSFHLSLCPFPQPVFQIFGCNPLRNFNSALLCYGLKISSWQCCSEISSCNCEKLSPTPLVGVEHEAHPTK